MLLLIDPAEGETGKVFFGLGTNWQERPFSWSAPGAVLGAVTDFCDLNNHELSDLRGLAVVVGRGRFTATRLAVTVANTLALALKIPVVGVTSVELATLPAVILRQPIGQYVHATYSAEARISQPKK